MGQLWRRRLTILRSSLEAVPSHPFAWLDRIRVRILVFLLARYGEEASGMPAGPQVRGVAIAWRRRPAFAGERLPRGGETLRPMLLDIAELNLARLREAILGPADACPSDCPARALHPCGRERERPTT